MAAGGGYGLWRAGRSGAGTGPHPETAGADEWMRGLYDLVMSEGTSPPAAARAYAYAAVALYETGAAGGSTYRSLAGQLNAMPVTASQAPADLDRPAAVNAAVATVVTGLFPSGSATNLRAVAQLERDQLEWRRSAGVPVDVVDRSAGHGRGVGEQILAWAGTDGYAATIGRPYQPRTGPGRWLPVPGLEAVEPYWGSVRPFALPAADTYQPPPPPAPYSAEPGSAFYAQARRVYDTGRALTDEKREIAMFWSDNPRLSGTPAGHWMLIGADLVRENQWPLDRAAQLYAVLAVALADAFTSCWHEKYRTNLLRPDAFIRTHIDSGWRPWVATPVYPEYTSGQLGGLSCRRHRPHRAGRGGSSHRHQPHPAGLVLAPPLRLDPRRGRGGRDLPALRRHPLPDGHRCRVAAG